MRKGCSERTSRIGGFYLLHISPQLTPFWDDIQITDLDDTEPGNVVFGPGVDTRDGCSESSDCCLTPTQDDYQPASSISNLNDTPAKGREDDCSASPELVGFTCHSTRPSHALQG